MGISGLFGKYVNYETEKLVAETVKSFSGNQVAGSGDHILCAESSKVGEYIFLSLSFRSEHNVQTTDGCEVDFKSGEESMTVLSDVDEIKTHYATNIGLGITELSIEVEDELKEFLNGHTVSSIAFRFKKQLIEFTEVDTSALLKLIQYTKED